MQRSLLGIAGAIVVIIVTSIMFCVTPGSGPNNPGGCDGTNNGFYGVLNPKSGASLKIDSQDTIIWSNKELAADSTVLLYLYKGKEFAKTIQAAANSGRISWNVPKVATGDNYQIKIVNAKDTSQFDFSCSFSIYSDYNGRFEFIKPTAAAVCSTGKALSIEWESTGNPGDSVSLVLCNDSIPIVTITNKIANSGSFTWPVPTTVSSKKTYRVKITSFYDPGVSTLSDPFTIIGADMDAYEPDNVQDSASLLDTLGKPQYHTLPANDTDWVKFVAENGTKYLIQLQGYVKGKFSFDHDTATIADLINSPLGWTCPKSGDYYLKFTSISDSLEHYSITVTKTDSLKTVVFIAPTAATVWNAGSSYRILWYADSALLGKTANIYLFKNLQQIATIAGGAPNSGSYSFDVDANLETGSDYQIKIVNASDTSRGGLSAYFTIQGRFKVVITSPTQGASWDTGSTHQIAWTPDTTLVKQVGLYLLKGQDQNFYIGSVPNNGKYNWTIPSGLMTGNDYRVKLTGVSNADSYGISSFFTINGISPDAFEPDNVRDSASTLAPLGKAQSHTLPMNDIDWVKFTIDSIGNYVVQCSGNRNLSTIVELFHENDASYTTSLLFPSDVSALPWKITKTGIWYARIASQPGPEGSAYVFNVTKLDSLTSVKILAPAQGDVWTAGSSYQIKWTADTAIFGDYVVLNLFKGTTSLASIIGTKNSGAYTWQIPSGIATGSDYRIKLSSNSNSDVGIFSSIFTINGMAPDSYEPDNKRDSASTLSPLGTAQSHSLTLNDVDWVKFSADSGRKYVVQCNGTISMMIDLYYGNRFASSLETTGNRNYLQWTCPRTGDYYVQISPFHSDGTGGSYTLNVSPFESVAQVSFSNPTASSVWSMGTSYTIQWTPDTAILGSNVHIQLYKGGNVISLIAYTSNSGSFSWTVPGGISTGSDYRIKVSNSPNDSFCGFSQVFSITGITPDSYEPDDSLLQASAITTDGVAQNRSLTLSDRDWIKVNAQKDSIYLISVRTGDNSLSAMFFDLYGDSTLSSTLLTIQGANPKSVWVCPKSGTYYLLISASTSLISASTSDYYGNYTVSIKTYSAASALSFTNPTAASIWSAGSSYSIQWVADTAFFGQNVRMQLYNDTTLVRSIVGNALNDGEFSWTLPAGLTTGGKYSIKLSSNNMSQIFGFSPVFTISGITPDAFEPDDSAGIAHAIATTGVAESHTLSSNDKDWFKFTAVENDLYIIKTIGAAGSMTLFGTDGQTSVATAKSSATDSSTTISMFCATPGTYYFRVTSSTVGAYQAMVTAYDSTKYDPAFTSPLSSDTLIAGQADTIKWSSQAPSGGNVDIYLNNGSGVVKTIVANAVDKGYYAWTIPSTVAAGNDYYIKIISRVSSHINGSSGVFTIKSN